MEINSISLLFKCSQCRTVLQSIREFLDHKLQNHILEFKTTKCILFEEIILPDQEFTSNDEAEFVNYSNEEESLGVEQQSTIQFISSESSSDQPISSKRLKLNDYETETVVSSTENLTTNETENEFFYPLAAAIKQELCHDQQLIVPYFEDNFENPTLQPTSPYLLECDVKTAISQIRAETETETETDTPENNSDEAFENFNFGPQEVEINVSDDNITSDDNNSSDSHSEPISSELNSSTLRTATGGYNFKVAKVKYEPDAFAVVESEPEPAETETGPELAEPEQDVVEILADLNDADGLQQAEIDPSDPDYEPHQNRRRSARKIALKSSRSKNTTTFPHRNRDLDRDLVSMPKLVANKKTKSPPKTVPFVFPSYETFRRDSRKTTRKTNSKIDSNEDENDDDLRTWLLKQRSRSRSISEPDENIILIQPDPIFNITTFKSLQSKPATKTSPSNPIHCALCCTKLISDEAVKVHVTYCWYKNKDKHRYCVPCKKTFSSAYLLQRHNDKIFLQEVEDKDPSFGGPKKYHLFKCRHCLQGFSAQMYLNHHMHSQHRHREKGGKNTNVSKKFIGSGSMSLRSSTSTTLKRNNVSASASASATKAKPTDQEYLIDHGGFKRAPAVLKREVNQVRKRKIESKQLAMAVGGNAQPAKSIECKVCERIFDISNLRKFETHMQSHFRSEARNFNCQFPNCTQAFKSELSLEIHFKAHTIGKAMAPNNASVAIQDANLAGENTFVDVSKPPLLEQELESEPELKPADQCTNDKYRRPSFSSAKKGVWNHGRHGVENLSALEKQKNFMKVRSVNVANSIISKMLGSKLKKSSRRLLSVPLFKCQICNWTFGTKKALEAHALVHLTEESAFNFKCTFAGCVRSFKEKSQLEQHLLAHGEKTKI